jgi:PelA/Pel-15E family pectate lyase
MMAAQNRLGGWPQFFPDTSGYKRYITFNDGAMIGVMAALFRIAEEDPAFDFVDGERRARVRASLARGVECILRCQVVQSGLPTAWCQQHDDLDFSPRGARTYEPAALASMESADIVQFLMRLEAPRADVTAAIRHAVGWFERSAIHGIRVKTVDAPRTQYQHHVSSEDVVVVDDPEAPPVWARYYELGSNRPLFCNRDGGVVYSLQKVERERRTGYQWYSGRPQAMLTSFSAWIGRQARGDRE